MFGFLKNKLKEAVNKFSKKAEEEAKVEESIKEEPEVKEIEVKQEGRGFFGLFKKKKVTETEEVKETIEIKVEHKHPEKEKVIEQKIEIKQPVEEKKGFFTNLTEKITTKKISEEKFNELFEDLELALLENNVAVEVIDKIKEDLKMDLVNVPLKGKLDNLIRDSLRNSLDEILLMPKMDLIKMMRDKEKKPFVICFFGINGGGKTTSIAKIAYLLKKNNLSVVLSASDTFRAASLEQIKEWGNRLNVKVISHDYGSDPTAVAFDSRRYCESHKIDVLLIDTAGRLHSNKDLMKEMEKIVRVIKPDLKIFVGEALSGSDIIFQVNEFNKVVGIDNILLTKSDVDEKGGALISAYYVSKKPIIYIGTGQEMDDLMEFDKEKILRIIEI